MYVDLIKCLKHYFTWTKNFVTVSFHLPLCSVELSYFFTPNICYKHYCKMLFLFCFIFALNSHIIKSKKNYIVSSLFILSRRLEFLSTVISLQQQQLLSAFVYLTISLFHPHFWMMILLDIEILLDSLFFSCSTLKI